MSPSNRLRLTLLAPLLFSTLAAAAIPLPREKEGWLTVKAGDFEIFSNAGDRATIEIATDLMRMREAVSRVTKLKTHSAIPTRVYIFRSASFAPYRDAVLQRKNGNVAGLFFQVHDGNFVLLQAGSNVDRVVYHELTHHFVGNTVSGLPLWFHEGIAEYYSTFAVKGDEVSLGQHVPEHIEWLRREPLIPLEKLFAVNSRSAEYNERHRQGAFYAQSWALVHYLLVGSEPRRQQLGTFLGELAKGLPIPAAFRNAFGAGFQELERELAAYVRRPALGYRRYTLDELKVPELAAPHLMTHDETLYALGHMLARANPGTLGDAELFLDEVLRLQPGHAGAHADLGHLADLRGDTSEATTRFDEAIALGSNDLAVYMAAGASILNRIVENLGGTAKPDAADIARARTIFTRATQLDPKSARAWAGLGATYVAGDADVKVGIEALERSLDLAPGQQEVAFYLVQLYARAGQHADARGLYERVLANSSDPKLVRDGKEAILVGDVRKAEELLRSGKTHEALTILRTVMAETTNDRLKAHVAESLRLADAASLAETQVDVVNQAISSANAGRIEEALKIIDELLPKITDAEFKQNVTRLRTDLAKAKR